VPDLPVPAAEPSDDHLGESASNVWLAVCDDLLWGFNHALSNRLAAITSITRILEYSDTGLEPLLSALSDEIVTLERTLNLLRLVPRNPNGTEEPVILDDLLPEVLRLHQVRGDLLDLVFDLKFEGEAQPVWLEPARLTHALLVALGTFSRAAMAAGDKSVEVRVSSSESAVVIELRAHGQGVANRSSGTIFTPDEAGLMRLLIGGAGGNLEEGADDRGRFIVLRLPTLLAVRERERDILRGASPDRMPAG
jgi:hypothetical protein